jgi:hypothetical protein
LRIPPTVSVQDGLVSTRSVFSVTAGLLTARIPYERSTLAFFSHTFPIGRCSI